MTALGRKQTKVFHDLRHACLVTPWTTCMLILCRMQGYSITMLPGHPSSQKQYRQTIPMQHHCHIFFCTSCCFWLMHIWASNKPLGEAVCFSSQSLTIYLTILVPRRPTYFSVISLTVCGLLWYRGRAHFTPFRADSPHELVIVMLSLGLKKDLHDLI